MTSKPDTKLKPILLALGIVLAGIGGKTGDYYLRPTVNLGMAKATQSEYDQLLPEMNSKIKTHLDDKTPIPHNEINLWLAICAVEIKKNNGLRLVNVTNENAINKLLTWMETK